MTLTRPTLDVLVAQMNGAPATNGWDVVTSYSRGKLNDFLTAKHAANQLVSNIAIDTTGLDPLTGASFNLTIKLALGAPLLEFLEGESGKCQLTMPIGASTYQINALPAKPIPENTYQVVCTVPLAAMSGATGAVTLDSQLVQFVQGTPDQNHIILHFKSTSDTTYEVGLQPGVTKQDRPQDDILQLYVVPKLQSWFATNVSELDYALTAVSNAVPNNDVTLQPDTFVFATAGAGDEGVLSIYIQTVGSGNNPGNLSPSFQPGDVEMLPIPAGHTASIIFAHDLISKAYIQHQLANATETAAAKGMTFTFSIDKEAITNKSDTGFWGGFSVDNIDVNLKANPLTLTIAAGTLAVGWEYHPVIEWANNVMFSQGGTSGRVYLDISLKKSVPISISDDGTNVAVKASLAIGASDYTIDTHVDHFSYWEILGSAGHLTNEMPPELEADQLGLNVPSATIDLGTLGFFGVTNLLFPGQHVIDFDQTNGVQTPHDVMLLGQIASTSKKAAVALPHLARVAAPAPKGAAALVHAFLTQDAVTGALYNLAVDADKGKLEAWLTQNGYDFPDDALAAVVASVRPAKPMRLAVGDPPAPAVASVQLWSGVYGFSAPDALKDKQLVVSGKTGRVTLGGAALTLTSTTVDTITWATGTQSFALTFTDHVKDTGEADPTTVAGTITTAAAEPGGPPTTEAIAGAQLIYKAPPPEDDWHKVEGLEQAVLVIGTFASVLGIIQFVNEIRKGRADAQAAAQQQRGRDNARAVEMGVINRQAPPDAGVWNAVKGNWETSVQQRINEAIRNDAANANRSVADIVANLPADLTGTLSDSFNTQVWDGVKPNLVRDLGGLQYFFDVNAARPAVLQNVAQGKLATLLQNDGYVAQVKSQLAAQFKKEALRRTAEVHRRAAAALDGRVRDTKAARDQAAADLKVAQDARAGLSGDALARAEARVVELSRDLDARTREFNDADQQQRAESDAQRADTTAADQAEATENQSRDAAAERARGVFGE